MIKITITDTPIIENKGVSAKTGKAYHMRTQTGYAHVMSDDGVLADFPEKFEFSLEEGQAPYPRGSYTLQPSMVKVKVDAYGKPQLVLGRPRLVAVQAAAAPRP